MSEKYLKNMNPWCMPNHPGKVSIDEWVVEKLFLNKKINKMLSLVT